MTFAMVKSGGTKDGRPVNHGLGHKGAELLHDQGMLCHATVSGWGQLASTRMLSCVENPWTPFATLRMC